MVENLILVYCSWFYSMLNKDFIHVPFWLCDWCILCVQVWKIKLIAHVHTTTMYLLIFTGSMCWDGAFLLLQGCNDKHLYKNTREIVLFTFCNYTRVGDYRTLPCWYVFWVGSHTKRVWNRSFQVPYHSTLNFQERYENLRLFR